MAILSKAPPLDEQRVLALRAEIDKFIDERVAEMKKLYDNQPVASLRISLTRGLGCQCATFLEMKAKEQGAA